MREDQAKLPWCRKGGVMVSVDNLGEEGFGWPSASGTSTGRFVRLFPLSFDFNVVTVLLLYNVFL
jgi:hypothetical protein